MHRAPLAVLLSLSSLAALAVTACDGTAPTELRTTAVRAAEGPSQRVVADGLLYPRGIAFHDGAIYVAEAGNPQDNFMSTAGVCPQVQGPPTAGPGPWVGGAGGRISRVTPAGARTTVASGLPSARNAFGDVDGTADVAFVGPKLYALFSAGCSRGNLAVPSSVARIHDDGSFTVLTDLSAWIHANPSAHPSTNGDFEYDGDFYDMRAAGGVLYVVEANSGNLLSVQPNSGRVERIADVSATQGHVVPTGLDVAHDDLLVGELTPFPSVPGSSELLRFSRNGRLEEKLGGFTAVLGVQSDGHGNTYVLESFTCPSADPCFPSPGSGRVVRIAANGARSVVASGLSFATALRMGPDGALYVSNFGYGPPGMGEIVRIVP
jgi:hypothetical protein